MDSWTIKKFCVCDGNNENCMVHHCEDCPNKLNVENYLREMLFIKFSENDVIKYKQWVSTDKSQSGQGRIYRWLYYLIVRHVEANRAPLHCQESKSVSEKFKGFIKTKWMHNYPWLCWEFFICCSRHCTGISLEECSGYNSSICCLSQILCHRAFACISDHVTHNTVTVYVFVEKINQWLC